MDWINHRADFTDHDFEVFEYESGHQNHAVIITKTNIDDYPVREVLGENNVYYNDIETEEKLEEKVWTKGEDGSQSILQLDETSMPGFYLIAFNRAPDVFGGQATVTDLLCSRPTWKTITKTFHVHRTITRTILRDVSYFSSLRQTRKDSGALEISYTARMAAALPDDLALSSTYIPSTNTTYSVIYGCNKDQLDEIWDRVRSSSASDNIDHPLLAIGIFLELDRIRLINMADKLADEFTLGSDILETRGWDPNNPKMQRYLEVCLRSRTLVDYIRAVKRQLVKVLTEIDDLERLWSRMKKETSKDDEVKNEKLNMEEKRERMIETGNQMKQRIRDMMDEYDDKIDECKKMAQNLSLAMQTGWNQIARQDSITNTRISHVNTMIALETKRESSQMRSIALLTMIYLPLSCVASVFSTTLFNWNPAEGESVVSKYIWVLITLAVVLTFITVLAWHLWTSHEKRREEAKEAQSKIDMSGGGFGVAGMV